MKKLLTILIVLFTVSSLFADNVWNNIKDSFSQLSNEFSDAKDSLSYYQNCDDSKNTEYFKKEDYSLRHTMYVTSISGINVRTESKNSSKILCNIPLNMSVKIIKLCDKEVVDGLESYWVKIYIPRYLQKTTGTKYGYVFGAYLNSKQKDLKTLPQNWSNKNVQEMLYCGNWWNKETSDFCTFTSSGIYIKGNSYKSYNENGTWKVISTEQIELKPANATKVEKVSFSVIDAWTIKLNDQIFENLNNMGAFVYDEPVLYNTDKNGRNFLQYYSMSKSNYDMDFVQNLIEEGLSAENSKFNLQYNNYWDIIMYTKEYNDKTKPEYIRSLMTPVTDVITQDAPSSYKNQKDNKLIKGYIASADIDSDLFQECLIYDVNPADGQKSFLIYDSKDEKLTFLSCKENINFDIEKSTVEFGLAQELEIPVPYLIINTKKDKNDFLITYYSIKGNTLLKIAEFDSKVVYKNKNPNEDFLPSYYFTKNGINTYMIIIAETGYIKEDNFVEYTQNVNNPYNFTAKKKFKFKK